MLTDHSNLRPPTDATQWRPYLRQCAPSNYPVFRLPSTVSSNRQPLTANRYFTLISFTNVSCGACLLVFQPPGSAV
jgi:hypothetical protein